MIYKTKIQNFISFPTDIIGIALPGSEQFEQCMEMLLECYNREAADNNERAEVGTCKMIPAERWVDCPAYDYLEYFCQTWKDAECTQPDCPEEHYTARRPFQCLANCIGILLSNTESPDRPHHAGNKWLSGTMYQLLYPGDEVFVMNESGATFHTVR